MLEKPAWPISSSAFSVEPAMIAVQSPRRIVSAASPTQDVPVEQAVTTQMLWPMAPVSMAIIPDVESTSELAMKVGETRSGPRSFRTSSWSFIISWPPLPEP
jgi:hypothetical protein